MMPGNRLLVAPARCIGSYTLSVICVLLFSMLVLLARALYVFPMHVQHDIDGRRQG